MRLDIPIRVVLASADLSSRATHMATVGMPIVVESRFHPTLDTKLLP